MQFPGRPELGHLTYCTNIHPGETWPEVLAQLQAASAGDPRRRRGPTSRSASGCALGAPAARGAVGSRQALAELKIVSVGREQLRLHHQRFSLRQLPWPAGEDQRLRARLVRRRSGSPTRTASPTRSPSLLPDGMRGSISTVPGDLQRLGRRARCRRSARTMSATRRTS